MFRALKSFFAGRPTAAARARFERPRRATPTSCSRSCALGLKRIASAS
jgi:hypothetical protein